ncbi:hypothetical protein [Clostridium sp.]|uniref:hypothetical protein n=1 Tax=Clostridium sp. TaxID=1506 RepID=UPI003463D0BA
MKETSLKLAQQDIEDALSTVESMEKILDDENLCKTHVKDKFLALSKKVQEIESILKEEGIL